VRPDQRRRHATLMSSVDSKVESKVELAFILMQRA
jgi:hypothetical protein